MFDENDHQFFESALFQVTGQQHQVHETRQVAGGCINHTLKVESQHGEYFLKWNDQADDDLFEKEAKGLMLLREADCIMVPEVLGLGKIGTRNFLIITYMAKKAPKADFWQDFGQSLAALHRNSHDQYGLDFNNHIGRLPQKNDYHSNWIDFFINNRLEVQLSLARYNGLADDHLTKRMKAFYAQLPGLIPDEPPSLLHGDLWSGNFMVGPAGSACIFDPAVYYGHREMELAFTRLFGGFDQQFYQSYHEAYPIEPGFENRIDIYNLYPLLVHVNLFGSSYLSGIERTLRYYLGR